MMSPGPAPRRPEDRSVVARERPGRPGVGRTVRARRCLREAPPRPEDRSVAARDRPGRPGASRPGAVRLDRYQGSRRWRTTGRRPVIRSVNWGYGAHGQHEREDRSDGDQPENAQCHGCDIVPPDCKHGPPRPLRSTGAETRMRTTAPTMAPRGNARWSARTRGREVPAMAIDVGIPRSRRAVLAAALGGLAASAAHAVSRPAAALATDGQPVVQGADNSGSASTLVRSNTTTALQGLADAASGACLRRPGPEQQHRRRGRRRSGHRGDRHELRRPRHRGQRVRRRRRPRRGPGPGRRGHRDSTPPAVQIDRRLGRNASQFGAGVLGESTATNGSGGIGVVGIGPGIGVSGALRRGRRRGPGSAAALTGSGVGVVGYTHSPTGQGVHGEARLRANSVGVFGHGGAGSGVVGWISTGGITPLAPKTGVYGQCDVDASSAGMYGRARPVSASEGARRAGIGVFGEATGPTGTALKVSGKAVFTRSGKANVLRAVRRGQRRHLTSSSLVLATIQGSAASGRLRPECRPQHRDPALSRSGCRRP